MSKSHPSFGEDPGPCLYLSCHQEQDVDDGGEGPMSVGLPYVVHDCEAPEECIRPGDPCPAKGPTQLEDEWLAAMETRLTRAKLFISGGVLNGS